MEIKKIYVVATVYPSWNTLLNSYDKMDIHKVFPGISDDSINHMFAHTGESRDMVRSAVSEIMYSEGFNGLAIPQYVLIDQFKATPGKESEYESLEMKDWRPIHQDLIKNGYESAFLLSRLIFPSEVSNPYNYTIFRFFDNAAMLDKQNSADWDKYMKANPAAFNNAGILRTDVHTELLHKVTSLNDK